MLLSIQSFDTYLLLFSVWLVCPCFPYCLPALGLLYFCCKPFSWHLPRKLPKYIVLRQSAFSPPDPNTFGLSSFRWFYLIRALLLFLHWLDKKLLFIYQISLLYIYWTEEKYAICWPNSSVIISFVWRKICYLFIKYLFVHWCEEICYLNFVYQNAILLPIQISLLFLHSSQKRPLTWTTYFYFWMVQKSLLFLSNLNISISKWSRKISCLTWSKYFCF